MTVPCRAVTGEIVCHGPREARRVALTFDDGPTARGVEALVPLLKERGVTATFFLEGKAVAERPELVRALVDVGHEIGNHSWSHGHMAGLGSADYLEELRRTDAALMAAGAPRPAYFRPPYGMKFVGLGHAVSANGQQMVTWDVEEPGAGAGAEAYVDAIMAQVRPGSIILVHPMFASRAVEREAVPILLDRLAAEGYAIGTVAQLLEGRE
nr:polysaccharide deacetylase family protein [Sphingomicrobium aestuariivivum]